MSWVRVCHLSQNGLYIVGTKNTSAQVRATEVANLRATSDGGLHPLMKWHLVFQHRNFSDVRKILAASEDPKLREIAKDPFTPDCVACAYAKTRKRNPAKKSDTPKAKERAERIHSDIYGPVT